MDNRLNFSQNRFDNAEDVASAYHTYWDDSEDESENEDEDTSSDDETSTADKEKRDCE